MQSVVSAQVTKPLFNKSDILDKQIVNEEEEIYRVITNKGDVYFVDDDNKPIKYTGKGYCGNFKPYIEYEIKEEKDIFKIYEVCGTFAPYTVSNVILVDSIKLKESVNVLFCNGQKTINYSSYSNVVSKDSLEYILERDGQYSLYSQPDIWYDSIVFARNPSELIVKKEEKYGLGKITALKYKELKRLNEYLFIGELFDGRKVYVDTQGREYFPRK